jgi:hypothetical protein
MHAVSFISGVAAFVFGLLAAWYWRKASKVPVDGLYVGPSGIPPGPELGRCDGAPEASGSGIKSRVAIGAVNATVASIASTKQSLSGRVVPAGSVH